MKKKIVIVISSVLMAFIMTASVFSIITFVKVNEDKSEKAIELFIGDEKICYTYPHGAGKLNGDWYFVWLQSTYLYIGVVNVKTGEVYKKL